MLRFRKDLTVFYTNRRNIFLNIFCRCALPRRHGTRGIKIISNEVGVQPQLAGVCRRTLVSASDA